MKTSATSRLRGGRIGLSVSNTLGAGVFNISRTTTPIYSTETLSQTHIWFHFSKSKVIKKKKKPNLFNGHCTWACETCDLILHILVLYHYNNTSLLRSVCTQNKKDIVLESILIQKTAHDPPFG